MLTGFFHPSWIIVSKPCWFLKPNIKAMKTTNEDYKSIPGWGMDADPENEPTYPMKNYTGDDHQRINYERSPQQPLSVEILQSTERPAPSVIFGTSVPPSGLSG